MLTGNDHEQAISTLGQGPRILSLRGMCPVAKTYPKRTAFESLESQIRLSTTQRAKRKGSSISRFSWASSKLDALPRAAATGNVAKLQTLIDIGHPVDHVDSVHGYTALHNASMSGCISAVKLLLSSGASVSMCDRDGATALHHAAQNGHVDASSLLVQSGSNVNATDNTGHAPLCCALQNGHISVVNALLEVGAIMVAAEGHMNIGQRSLHQ
jgi:ankyrin repeat protein